MWLELRPWNLLLLCLLLPQPQAARVRCVDFLPQRVRQSHCAPIAEDESSESQLQFTMQKKAYHQHHRDVESLVDANIVEPGEQTQRLAALGSNSHASLLDTDISTDLNLHQHTVVGCDSQSLTSMLDTPVSGPNPGVNVQSFASILDTHESSSKAGIDSHSLGSVLGTSPKQGGNTLNFAGMLDADGNSQNLLLSGLNAGNTKKTFSSMLDIPVSGPNPGGNSISFTNILNTLGTSPNAGTVLGGYVSGDSQSLAVSKFNLVRTTESLTSMPGTPVSGPNPGGNSKTLTSTLDTPISGQNPGGNFQNLASLLYKDQSPGDDSQNLGISGPNMRSTTENLISMLDTPVLALNPGGNSESLMSMLDTPVSGPVLGGDSQSFASMLSNPISGQSRDSQSVVISGSDPGSIMESLISMPDAEPKPEDNSGTVLSRLGTEVSSSNLGRNSEKVTSLLHMPVSGPYLGGNTRSHVVSRCTHDSNVESLASKLDIPVSGPNPGGNSENLRSMLNADSSSNIHVSGSVLGDNTESLVLSGLKRGCKVESLACMLDTPVLGPNPRGSSKMLVGTLDSFVSGPILGSDRHSLTVSRPDWEGKSYDYFNMLDTPESGPNPGGNFETLSVVSGPNPGTSTNGALISNRLPRALVPPSSPSPTHNSQITQRSLYADESMRRQTSEAVTDCGVIKDNMLHSNEEFLNTVTGMGVASLENPAV